MGESSGLFLNHGKKLLIFISGGLFLAGKNFQICLHDRKGCAKLMRGTGRKLFLCGKGIIQTGKHFIKGKCQIRDLIVAVRYFKWFGEVLCLDFFNFCAEIVQWF